MQNIILDLEPKSQTKPSFSSCGQEQLLQLLSLVGEARGRRRGAENLEPLDEDSGGAS